jgi:hypothetical protein
MDERKLQAAIDELQREFDVRARCYDRWITEKKLTVTDARDRLERLNWAIVHLRQQADQALGSEKPTGTSETGV